MGTCVINKSLFVEPLVPSFSYALAERIMDWVKRKN